MRSLSEIETAVKRASRAVGYSWGNSEEIGKSIRQLELFGFQGIKNLNKYYKDKSTKKFEDLNIINEINETSSDAYCPIILGISFLDQIKSVENFKTIKFKKIAYPVIFLSFLSRASEISGNKIHVRLDQNEILLNLNVNICSNFLDQDIPEFANEIEIKFIDNKDSFTESEWNSLYKLAEDTFVEESDSLKEGAAGAGLTDND
ncbi:DUF3726 domain-containing protein [Candidatus Pelagibacter bacterium]|jgi:hypothetical protein|nr:DUF3726 domain-containing protein [Candidatus Pelagibacter bacterium]MDA8778369.1 DUF3726 domain-containing protein [Candidatus Pelagibacter bacterium]MDB2655409.1 DUF3726 domain-containing protein [Candidatus Pelagibacter bacterium]MDB4858741.1 DUF3726 domain-containing protein [Candidatus Pelagibacter sp.]MDC1176188.1 DUF3726 domain-containing protein [Candidatus Pelagibacter sp.]